MTSTQSKEERAMMKNAARTHRSQKARDLLAKLIHDQHKVDVDPGKLTSTKYNRDLGWKFVPLDEQNYPWPFISTSQISSQDLGMLEAALTNGKVEAVKDDMYNAAAAFRSRSSRPSQTMDERAPREGSSHDARPTAAADSGLFSLAEASSASQSWQPPSQTWGAPINQTPQTHRETLEGQATGGSTVPSNISPTDPIASMQSSPSNPRKRPYPFEDRDFPLPSVGETHIRIKVPRSSISEILEREATAQITKIRDLETKLLDLDDDMRRQGQELQKFKAENDRLKRELSLRSNEELERLRAENEHLKALGRKLFE